MVEGLWPNTTQKARVFLNVHSDRRSLCNHHRSLLYTAGGLGGAISPPAASGQSPGGVQEAKSPEARRIFYFTGLKRGLTEHYHTVSWRIFTSPVNVCNTRFKF